MYSEKEPEEMWKEHGHLFPQWDDQNLTYDEVAMAHGWIRLLLTPHTKRCYIELIKGRVAPIPKRLLMTLIKAIEPYVEEYVIEYATGTTKAANNFTTPNARKALALVA